MNGTPNGSCAFEFRDMVVDYRDAGRVPVRVVDGVTLAVDAGETVGLIGESGSGKSSLARAIVGLVEDVRGEAAMSDGTSRITDMAAIRRHLHMVFQDPGGSLNPRLRIGTSVAEPLAPRLMATGRGSRRARAVELLRLVGLDETIADRRPHELSGGQKQRAAIARALAGSPRLLICDEAVSALDVSVQAEILNLLAELQADRGLAYLFISHDLAVVAHLADVVAVMYLGQIVETGPIDEVLARPRHPYTQALLDAEPAPEPGARNRARANPLAGDIPSPASPPAGCRFHTRCEYAEARCTTEEPSPTDFGRVTVKCHLAGSLTLRGRRAMPRAI